MASTAKVRNRKLYEKELDVLFPRCRFCALRRSASLYLCNGVQVSTCPECQENSKARVKDADTEAAIDAFINIKIIERKKELKKIEGERIARGKKARARSRVPYCVLQDKPLLTKNWVKYIVIYYHCSTRPAYCSIKDSYFACNPDYINNQIKKINKRLADYHNLLNVSNKFIIDEPLFTGKGGHPLGMG